MTLLWKSCTDKWLLAETFLGCRWKQKIWIMKIRAECGGGLRAGRARFSVQTLRSYSSVVKVKQTDCSPVSQSANRFQKPIKSVNTFGDAPSANNTLACFQWWTSIASPTGLKLLESVFVRLHPVRVRWDGCERQDWPAGERFVTQKSAERQNQKKKSPHHSQERAENKNKSLRRRKIKHTKTK